MLKYILKRLLVMLPTLLMITLLSYMMMRVAPGDPVKSNMLSSSDSAGEMNEGESEAAKQFRKHFGLDKPWYVGYWYWLTGNPNIPGSKGIIRGDFGISITVNLGTPVAELLKERLPPTLKLNLLSMLIMYLFALPIGIYSAIFRDSFFDRVTSLILFMLYSLPSFWIALLAIIFISKYLPWWPTSDLDPSIPLTSTYWHVLLETSKHYVLPILCLSYGSFTFLSRFTRSTMLDVIKQDYIRTARAKGLSSKKVIFKHALRNSIIPLITTSSSLLPALIVGSVFIEFIFRIPGMGMLSLEAISSRDYPLLMTTAGITATLTLIGILVSDILYGIVDPRISLDK